MISVSLIAAILIAPAQAAVPPLRAIALVGGVERLAPGQRRAAPVRSETVLQNRDVLRTRVNGRLRLQSRGGANAEVAPGTLIRAEQPGLGWSMALSVARGALRVLGGAQLHLPGGKIAVAPGAVVLVQVSEAPAYGGAPFVEAPSPDRVPLLLKLKTGYARVSVLEGTAEIHGFAIASESRPVLRAGEIYEITDGVGGTFPRQVGVDEVRVQARTLGFTASP